MKNNKIRILKATVEERRLIETLTSKPVFARLDAGELDIVPADDWSHVPELADTESLAVPTALYRKLKAASRKRHTTPDRLAARLLAKMLAS